MIDFDSNPKIILEEVVDPNKDKKAHEIAKSGEVGNKHKSGVPKYHHISNVIRNMDDSMVTMRRARQNEIDFLFYTSQLEPKNVEEALGDESWITALQEELNQFVRNDVWYLVPRLKDKHVISTKWIFKNKQDENGIIVKNKARPVAQGYFQIEEIDF